MINVRMNVFETNSSSVHTLVICDQNDFKKWVDGKLYLDIDEYADDHSSDFVTFEVAQEKDENFPYSEDSDDAGWGWSCWTYYSKEKDMYIDKRFLTYNEFFENNWYETYHGTYTTPLNEQIEAFGYYGQDG